MEIIAMRNSAPVVSHRVIAEQTNNEQRAVVQLITQNLSDFEEFGNVYFEVATLQTNGGKQQAKTYYLNEQQATLLFTYLRNNETVRRFKITLVKAFYELRNQPPQIDLPPYPLQRENIELKRAINRMTENEKLAKNIEFINYANHHDFLDMLANMSYAINTIEELFLHLKRYDGSARSYVDRILARFPNDEGLKTQAKAKTSRQRALGL
jgi:phage regulator Rha-like protein